MLLCMQCSWHLNNEMLYCNEFRVQLGVCTLHIIKQDFPHKWTGVVDSIQSYLNSADTNLWAGALLCLYQLNKNYE